MAQTLISETKYSGRYVAVKGFNDNTVVGDGKDPQEAYDKALKRGVVDPVILFVPLKDMVQIYQAMELINTPFTKFSPDDLPRPWLPITVTNPHTNKTLKLYGLIDTGADECALPAQYAVLLGHELQKGYAREINTGNGKTLAYSHTVRIEVPNFTVQDTRIDFMPNLYVPLLGVKSFLSSFILTIDYPNQVFSLKSRTQSLIIGTANIFSQSKQSLALFTRKCYRQLKDMQDYLIKEPIIDEALYAEWEHRLSK